jgi:hypothetical protein
MQATEHQQIVDNEHLRLLSIFYYVSAGTTALIACIPIMHLLMGIVFIVAGESMASDGNDAPPSFIGWFICGIASFVILTGWTIAFLKFLAGRYIAQKKNHTFCLVIAGFSCLAMPYGTILGVMTFMVLLRDSVKAGFNEIPALDPNPPATPEEATEMKERLEKV